jgi:alpha-1,3-rhamnosyltransferase
MNQNNLVSVIISSYNHINYVEHSIKSVLRQTYSEIEIILIDDGSSDGSSDFLVNLAIENDFLLITQNNMGISNALNNAIRKHSSGKYIAILASDDYYHPDKIEKQVCMLESNPGAELCYSQALEFDDSTGAILRKFPIKLVTGNALNSVFLRQPYAAGSILFTRNLFDRIGGFDEALKFEDWDFSIRAAAATRFVAVKTPLIYYRFHGGNVLKKWTRRQLFAEKIKILAKNYSLVSPAYWFFVVLVHFVHDHARMVLDRLRLLR